MSFDITSIADAGDIDRERVVIKATTDGDIGRFAIFCAKRSSTGVALSGNVPKTFWFTDQKVKAGDFIVLYTKAGTRSSKTSDSGSTSYFFYWGWKTAIWDEKSKAALIDINSYKYPPA
jgi:hypothetical protein